jgi:hypothetical protein
VALAAAAAAVIVIVAVPGDDTDLAARAYAATNPDEGVLYTELVTEVRMPGDGIDRVVTRIWQRGDRVRYLTDLNGERHEHVVAGDVLRTRRAGGKVLTLRDPLLVRRLRTDFVERFRARYEQTRLREAGRATFAGRPAVMYHARGAPGRVRETYYLDAESGLPLGSEHVEGDIRHTEVVRKLERLPATPENLAQLELQPR